MPHTWFLQSDHARVSALKISDFPYIVAIALAELGRTAEVVPALRELEQRNQTRLRDFIVAARTLIEGDGRASIAAVNRIVASDFGDPEGLFYLSRHLAHLNETGPALALLERAVGGGFFCFPAMASDPWLDRLRKKPAFTKLLRRAEHRQQEAAGAFARLHGEKVSGRAS